MDEPASVPFATAVVTPPPEVTAEGAIAQDEVLAVEDTDGADVAYMRNKSNLSGHTSHSAMTVAELKGLHKASLLSVTANLANTILGSGMLGLPHTLAECGLLLGIVLLCVFGSLSAFACHLLGLCSHHLWESKEQPASFYVVALESVPKFSFLIDLAVAVKCFGVGCSYLIVVGDMMPDFMDAVGASGTAKNRQLWVLAGWVAAAVPASMPRLDSLRFTSGASVLFVIFITIMIVLYASDFPGLDPCRDGSDSTDCAGSKKLVVSGTGPLKVLTVFIFGFTCQQNMFTVCNEVSKPSPARYNAVIALSILTALAVYLAVAVAGYSTYGDAVDSDILTSYPVQDIVTAARLFVTLLIIFSYPLQAHPSRRCAVTLMEQVAGWWARRQGDEQDAEPASERVLFIRYWSYTVFYLVGTLAIALSVDDLGYVLAVVGATGSTAVQYILPGICYYKMFPHPHLKRYLALALFCLGCVIVPTALSFIFAL